MELTDEHLETIRQECRNISFGKIIIELNEKEHKIDVISQRRVRISSKNDDSNENIVDKKIHLQ
jgi:hypothetical protein